MLIIKNIKQLVQAETSPRSVVKGSDMNHLPIIENAFLIVKDGIIQDFGAMDEFSNNLEGEVIDAKDKFVLPCWCDSHTHLVFAGSRETEFVDRIKGLTYQEIAHKGGGILNSAKRLQNTSEEELFEQALSRLHEVIGYGTGAIEIKSGYGLTVESELKILRVIKKLKKVSPISIKATFLGAHSIPLAYKENRKGYIDLIINEMLPKIAQENLADYIDVFCEKVAFSVEETIEIMKAGAEYGLRPKIHTNQFNCMGGIEASVAHGALSVDHLEVLTDEEIACLKDSDTMPCLLPSAPFFINDHYPPARKIIDQGLPVALATDYNPGSTPSGKMPFVLSLACIKMRMTPEEAINAATINGAKAMELEKTHGSIAKGKVANFFITKRIPSLAYIPYSFGSDVIEDVYIKGKIL
jgi:imidazolonepropionase